ncbi:hypothetical protein C5D04_10215 [Rathayibacter sp. AY1D2]|nr:hypothetical protein C5C52_12760 [Rathayibacter sp. AY1E5]PPH43711.1 hypothetical protein C5D09_14440 [Rathayibacter sp. AY1C9]PPH96846.1 hypothetical protein C5C56_13955 [Rathayibacter sp. AY1D1]PPI13339.1 hypothetical protein C5D04_10215 [Rathayibacter sp. AY1D2]
MTMAAAAGLLAGAALFATATPASAVQYSGGYFPTYSACRAEVQAYRADGWTILKNCPYVPGYGYLVDASKG